jgi:hypothetical protein
MIDHVAELGDLGFARARFVAIRRYRQKDERIGRVKPT